MKPHIDNYLDTINSIFTSVIFSTGVSNTAFRHLMEFTYTATLAVVGDEEAYDVWKAAEYLQMQEALKALGSQK